MSVIEQQLANTLVEPGTKIPVKGSSSHREIYSKLNQSFEMCKANRQSFERQWYLNLAFFRGKQWIQFNSSTAVNPSRFIDPPAPPWRVRLTSNQVRRYVRKEFAKVTKEKPTGFVIPASADDADQLAARAGEAVIEHLWRETGTNAELRRAVLWAVICGTGFLKDWYNKKNREQDNVEDMPALERVTPFHLWIPDVATEDIEKQECVWQGMTKHTEWVFATYGKRLAETGTYNKDGIDSTFLNAMGISDRQSKNSVYIKEGWFKPGGIFPNGACAVIAGEEILYFVDEYPYDHGEYPFHKIENIPTGQFYSESAVTDLIPLQKEYNRTRSQIIEAKNRMAKPQLAAPRGSIDVTKITSEPGLVIEYRPGFQPPTPIPLQSLPGYVIEELDRNISDMDNITSQHEVSRGQAPTGVEAATAISYLQEQDDSVLSPFITSIEDACEKLGRHYLYHVSRNWDLERQIKVVGYGRQYEAYEFSKANLDGNTDYVVQAGSATPRSQAAKQAFVMDLIKNGLIPPEMGLKYLELSEAGRLYEELHIDLRQAQRENLRMAAYVVPEPDPMMQMMGQMEEPAAPVLVVNVNSWDNHVAHIMEHDAYRKRQEYETSSPEVQQQFEMHVQQHKLTMAAQGGFIPVEDPAMMIDVMYNQMLNGVSPVGATDAGSEQSQPQQ